MLDDVEALRFIIATEEEHRKRNSLFPYFIQIDKWNNALHNLEGIGRFINELFALPNQEVKPQEGRIGVSSSLTKGNSVPSKQQKNGVVLTLPKSTTSPNRWAVFRGWTCACRY